MRQSKSIPAVLLVAAVLGTMQCLGCGAPPKAEAPAGGAVAEEGVGAAQAPAQVSAEAVARALGTLKEADRAYAEKKYETARDLYNELLRDPSGLTPAQVATVRRQLQRVQSVLTQRAIEEQGKLAQAAAARAAQPAAETPAAPATQPTPAAEGQPAPTAAAEAQPAPETPAAEPAATVSAQEALRLLDEASQLCQQGKLAEAAPKITQAEAVRDQLGAQDKMRLDALRLRAEEAGALPPLAQDQRRARALEHLTLGLDARAKNDYLGANEHLQVASSLRADLGRRRNNELLAARSQVEARLKELRSAFAEGAALYAKQDLDGAEAALKKVAESGISLGKETDEKTAAMLADIAKARADRQAAARKQAEELLTAVQKAIADKNYEQAEASLLTLMGMETSLDARQRAQLQALRQQVADATGVMPGMSPQERLAAARRHVDAGLKAADQGKYTEAQKLLETALRMKADLGASTERKVRATLDRISAELASLKAAYEAGKDAYEKGDYRTAKERLTLVRKSPLDAAAQYAADVDRMLAGIDAKIHEQDSAQARRLLEEAAALAALAAKRDEGRQAARAKWEAADRAWQAEDYALAKQLLGEAKDILARPELAELADLQSLRAEVADRLGGVEQKIQEKARRDQLMARINELIAQAKELTATDVLAAEAKALEAVELSRAEGLPLSPAQVADLREVERAVREKFGPERALRRQQCVKLVRDADQYLESGELSKAAQALRLVQSAPDGLVTPTYSKGLEPKIAAVEEKVKAEQDAAARLVRVLDRAREYLQARRFGDALQSCEAIIARAREQGLMGPAMSEVLVKVAAFLKEDFAQAAQSVSPQLKADVDRRLGLLRQQVAAAEARQKEKAAAGAAARQAELRKKAERIYELAQQLDRLTREGKPVAAVQQQLADAQLELDLLPVRAALEAASYEEAAQLLAKVPKEKASAAAVQAQYQPLVMRLEKCRAAATALQAAEEALARYEFELAAARLNEAKAAASGEPVLADRLNGMAAVLDAVREARRADMAALGRSTEIVRQCEATIAEIGAREKAWQSYFGAVKAFVEGQTAQAQAAALSAVVAEGAGLRPFELSNAQNLLAALAEAGRPLSPLQRKLAQARAEVEASRYMQAAALLEELKTMPGYEGVQTEAEALSAQVAEAEARAAKLYAQAVEAFQAGDKQRVAALLEELKAKYSSTRAYSERK